MKINFIIMLFLNTTLFSNELKWVDEQIEAIKLPRNGVEIMGVTDPFVFLDKNRSDIKKDPLTALVPPLPTKPTSENTQHAQDTNNTKKSPLYLSTIINGSAMIDGNWYKKNDKIENYTVVDVNKTIAILKSDKKEILLSTESKTPTIKFKNK